MKKIWVISDTHLGHANILNFVDYNGNKVRNFDNVDQMDQCILDHWNEKVKPGDIVYNLGDVFFGDKEKFQKMWPKFNGRKRLIVGNHDDVKYLSSGSFFQKVMLWRMFSEHNILLSHVPIHESSLYRSKNSDKPMKNLHGHIHTMDSPPGPYVNVCVEKTNYYPVELESFIE